jgi:DNA (cytosine-5)-methyltransferase 1
MKLRVLDLFSGIGGFSLGLERTGGFETVAFCEIEDYPRRVLAKHWPGVPIYDDVRTLTADTLRRDGIAVDVICGGFPCQDVSVAGQRAGLGGERSGLWSEIVRLACELRPAFVIVENVAALLSDGMDRVLGDLAASGFDAEWECIPASALGFDHVRDRVWIVAYPNEERRGFASRRYPALPVFECLSAAPVRLPERPKSAILGVVNGVPRRVDRCGALGNAVVPQIPELIGRAILKAEGIA